MCDLKFYIGLIMLMKYYTINLSTPIVTLLVCWLTLHTTTTYSNSPRTTKFAEATTYSNSHRTTKFAEATTYSNSHRTTNTGITAVTTYSKSPRTTNTGITAKRVIQIAAILTSDDAFVFSYHRVVPAFEYAINITIRRLELLPQVDLRIRYVFDNCDGDIGITEAINMRNRKQVDVFFGPVCDSSSSSVVTLSRYWNIPVITPAMVGDIFHDIEYEMLTHIHANLDAVIMTLDSFLYVHNWTRGRLIYETESSSGSKFGEYTVCRNMEHRLFRRTVSDFRVFRKHPGYMFSSFAFAPWEDTPKLEHVVGDDVGVVILCATPERIKQLLLQAHKYGFDNGEYVFIVVDFFGNSMFYEIIEKTSVSCLNGYDTSEGPGDKVECNGSMDMLALYRSVMFITSIHRFTEPYQEFAEVVRENAEARFNFTYGHVNSYVTAFHDGLLLYAMAVNETLGAGGDICDGRAISRRMWNRTFQGITGSVFINEHGDRGNIFSILDYNVTTARFEKVAYHVYPSSIVFVEGRRIDWGAGRTGPPPDIPECGYGKTCVASAHLEYGRNITVILVSVTFIVLGAMCPCVRYLKKYRQGTHNWLVRWSDVMYERWNKESDTKSVARSLGRIADMISIPVLKLPAKFSAESLELTKHGVETVPYKGGRVVVKRLARTNFIIDNTMLVEVKTVRSLMNEHVCRFIAACLEIPNQCLLYEYCQKGKLQDVLENAELKLDWSFKYSLIQDLVLVSG